MTDQPFRIAFLLYPGVTQLDFTGPAETLARMPGAELSFVAASDAPVTSDCGLSVLPTATFADERRFDMICVPGGPGCTEAMEDEAALDWLRRQSAEAAYVTSVCTGSLVLAAAGLLRGYRAACHWAWTDKLALFGATPVRERVVIDRNRITAGGVTAGIDFGFRVIAERCGRDIAEAIQLGIEYAPEPLSGGTPDTARPEIRDRVTAAINQHLADRHAAIDRIAARFAAG